MPNQTARFDGLTEGLAVKRAVRVATTANITLSGLQTIDGIALAADDRVLVKDQSTQAQNGIYNVSSGPWTRARDGDGNGDWCQGTRVLVNSGTLNARKEYALTTADPIVLDTSAMTFTQIPVGSDTAGFIVSDMTLAVPGTYATVKLALAYLDNKIIASNALVTIEVTGHVSTSDSEALMTVRHPNANRIRLRGANTPLLRTIQTSGHTVSGTQGDYTVTMKLDSVANVTAGDVVRIGVVVDTTTYSSDTITYAPKNEANDLYWGIDTNRTVSLGKLTTSGTDLTMDTATGQYGAGGLPAAPQLDTNWLIFANGEARAIATRTDDTTFTISSAFTQALAAQAYWYRIKKAAGTINTDVGAGAVPSTTIEGVGTDFLTRCTIGDLLCVNGEVRRITAVNSDTEIIVSHNITIANGTSFGIYTMHEAHMGAFKITSVDSGSSTITYVNKTMGPYGSDPQPTVRLGANQLKGGGTVEILRDVIENTHATGHGIVIDGAVGLHSIDNIGLVGGAYAGGDALCSSSQSQLVVDSASAGSGFGTGGNIQLGNSVGVTNWGQAVRCQAGSASVQYLCAGNIGGNFALFAHQGVINADYACISGYAGFGAFIGPGGGLRCSGATFIGQRFASIYNNGGGSIYADGARSIAARIGYQSISAGGGHMVEFRACAPTLIGMEMISGGDLRAAGIVILGAGYVGGSGDEWGFGVLTQQSDCELRYGFISGSLSSNIIVQYASVDFNFGCTTGSAVYGMQVESSSSLKFVHGYATRNNIGVYASTRSYIDASDAWSDDNTTSDYTVQGPCSIINVDDYVGSPTFSQTRNRVLSKGSIIIDPDLDAAVKETRIINTGARAGATAGWTANGTSTFPGLTATLPASQTGSNLVIPIAGLVTGQTIYDFHVIGQIESGGNTVTLDAALFKHTAAAADPTTTSLGAITQISVTADTAVTTANGRKVLAAPETVGDDETFYVVLTGTTGSSTDIALMGVGITIGQ